MKSLLLKYRRFWILLCHLGIVAIAVAAAFVLRFDFSIPREQIDLLRWGLLLAVLVKVPVFFLARLYR